MTRDDDERVADIVRAIGRLQDIVTEGREAFDDSHILQAAAIYNIQVIGEATSRLSDAFRDERPNIPWRRIIGMRNLVVHRYFDVDVALVWETLTREIPQLNSEVGN